MQMSDIILEEEAVKENGSEISEEKKALLLEMAKAGIFYGRKKTKTHPKMKPFIYATRNGLEIIDVAQTLDLLEEAAEFLSKITKEGHVLAVGSQPSLKAILGNFAKKHKFPYVTERWIGGTLTNFKIIRARVEHFTKMKNEKETGRLDKYTKKERLEMDREIERMRFMYEGIESMDVLPVALFIIDPVLHKTAVKEARRASIPIVAIMSTDCDPNEVDYFIPANASSKTSVEWMLNYVSGKLAVSSVDKQETDSK